MELILRERGVSHILHYLDDFLAIGGPGTDECTYDLDCMLSTCEELGIPALDKVEGPTSCLTFLGISGCSLLPVDEYGRCISAKEVGYCDVNTKQPTKWKCSEECSLPSKEDIACICSIKTLCQTPMEELRHGLDELNKNCPNVHHGRLNPVNPCFDDMKGEEELSRLLLGHPLPCALCMLQ